MEPKRTYETQKFRCLSCKRLVYFGAFGMCQPCLEDSNPRESNGG